MTSRAACSLICLLDCFYKLFVLGPVFANPPVIGVEVPF